MQDVAKTVDYVQRRSGSFSAFNADRNLASALARRFEQLFVFAVIYEERQRSYEAFSRQFGVSLPCEQRAAAHASGKPPVSPRVEDLIRERNKLDLALLRSARSQLDQSCATTFKSSPRFPACGSHGNAGLNDTAEDCGRLTKTSARNGFQYARRLSARSRLARPHKATSRSAQVRRTSA